MYSFHPGGANVAIGDGSVRFLNEEIAPDIAVQMLTAKGGDDLGGDN